jgi:C1A family cysteine protease
MPNTTKEQLLGGHAILLIGYDDKTKVFKFQNSWGVGWGDKGYGYIPYDYVLDNNLAFDLCTVTFSLN